MKETLLFILVAFLFSELSLLQCLDDPVEISTEHQETKKDTESEQEVEKQEEKRRQHPSSFFLAYAKTLDISDQAAFDSFKILENEYFDLCDPPPEC